MKFIEPAVGSPPPNPPESDKQRTSGLGLRKNPKGRLDLDGAVYALSSADRMMFLTLALVNKTFFHTVTIAQQNNLIDSPQAFQDPSQKCWVATLWVGTDTTRAPCHLSCHASIGPMAGQSKKVSSVHALRKFLRNVDSLLAQIRCVYISESSCDGIKSTGTEDCNQ